MIILSEKIEYQSISDKAEELIDTLYYNGYMYQECDVFERPDGSKVEDRWAYRNTNIRDDYYELVRSGCDVFRFIHNNEPVDIDEFLKDRYSIEEALIRS